MAAHPLDHAVSTLLREVGREIVIPRFRMLAAGDIEQKGPDDPVTIADRLSEIRLGEGLRAILPEARAIGEEACSADPSLLDDIGTGIAWIIDPIDGTANYAAGRHPFAIMVALVENGETQAGWILDPASGRMCHAARGGGAYLDGAAIRARGTAAEMPVAALATLFLPSEVRADLEHRAAGVLREVPVPRCAGEQYPRVVLGQNDVALFWRALPWDHAAGALFVEEAGGRIARLDGTPYRPDQTGTGLLAAASPALWDAVHRILFD